MLQLTAKRLHEAVGEILTAVKDLLDQQTGDGGLLADVAEVRLGVLGRNRPTPPALAVTSPAGTGDQVHAQHESWTVPVELWSFVSTEEEGGEVEAILLALRARSAVLATDRTLGLPYIEDVQSADYEALGQHSQGKRVIARARLNVRLSIVEPPPEEQQP